MPTHPELPTTQLVEVLEEFLDAVQREVVELGVREHLEVRRLLQSRDSWAPEKLRAALAALLARNAEELRQIETLFDQYILDRMAVSLVRPPLMPGAAGSAPAGDASEADGQASSVAQAVLHERLTAPSPWSSLVGPFLAFVVIAAAATTVALAVGKINVLDGDEVIPVKRRDRFGTEYGGNEKRLSSEGAWELVEIQPKQERVHIAPRLIREFDLLDLLALIPAGFFFFLSIRWWMLPGAERAQRRQEVEARLSAVRAARREAVKASAEKGTAMHLSYHVPVYLPFNKKVLDDAVTLLGRVFGQQPGSDLDVSGTIRSTVSAGGRFVPVYEARRAPRGILVLIDVERGEQPWLAGFSRVLDFLVRQGVPIVRYRFQYSPVWAVPESGGRALHIHDLSRRHAQSALLLFSRRLSSQSHKAEASWTTELGAWALKAWIDPDPRAPGARRAGLDDGIELEQSGLRRFPWTEEGFLSLAAHLEGGGAATGSVPWPAAPRLSEPSVQRAVKHWALCAALVPDATWDQLEAIRRHKDFTDIGGVLDAPWHLQTLLDWTARQTGQEPESGDGRTLELTSQLVERLIRESREEAGQLSLAETLEARARRLLLEQLESKQPDDPLQRLRWELKIASHRLILEPAHAYELIASLYGTAVEEELREVLNSELTRQQSGLALGGQAIPRAAIQRLRAIEGWNGFMAARTLLLSHGHVTARAAVAAIILTSLLGLWTAISLHHPSSRDEMLRVPAAKAEVVLPRLIKVQPTSRAPPALSSPDDSTKPVIPGER